MAKADLRLRNVVTNGSIRRRLVAVPGQTSERYRFHNSHGAIFELLPDSGRNPRNIPAMEIEIAERSATVSKDER